MGGDIETIKDRLDIAEVVGSYVKLEKAGQSFKARCPFHNEKTPSFFVSPSRQSYYCFGCGAKGDIFSFVEEVEGLEFREALKLLAEKAGVELKKSTSESRAQKTEKEKILEVLTDASKFFEMELDKNKPARDYVLSRGINEASIKEWKIGYAPAEWLSLYTYLREMSYPEELLLKAGLAKPAGAGLGKSPYDVFRDRIIFPLSDAGSRIIAFSGRALSKDSEPKYLNSPDTAVFTKHEVLYGLDKAKDKIRRKDYAVLVEGQMDLVLSHQAGVDNTVASSGTAFTQTHLERLKRFSSRIILAFDGDTAGEKAAEKSAELAFSIGLEVKIASLPKGLDPAEVASKEPQEWKEILRQSLPAIEHFLNRAIEEEKDKRKLGRVIERKILPLIALLKSSIERSHFISLISKKTGIKEDVIWEDLKRVKRSDLKYEFQRSDLDAKKIEVVEKKSRREMLEERLAEVLLWLKEQPASPDLKKEEAELKNHLDHELLKNELSNLSVLLAKAETSKEHWKVRELTKKISILHKKMRALEENVL